MSIPELALTIACVVLVSVAVILALRLRGKSEKLEEFREQREERQTIEELIAWFSTMPNNVEFWYDRLRDRYLIRTQDERQFVIIELGDEQLSGGFAFWGPGIEQFEEGSGGLLHLFHRFVAGYPNLRELPSTPLRHNLAACE